MYIEYEEALYEGTLYINNELVDTLTKLKNPSITNNVYIEISNRYHFYETPWERDDKFDVTIMLDGKNFGTWGLFKNKSRRIILKGNFIEK